MTLTLKVDGGFGKISEKALKLFQWVLANSNTAVKNKTLVKQTAIPRLVVSGRLDPATASNLQTWIKNKLSTTGDLVRVDTTKLSNISLGHDFKHIAKPRVKSTD